MSNFDKVGTFMKTFGQEVKTKPSFSSDKINKLRIDLIKEELEEKGIKQTWLAEKLEKSYNMVNEYVHIRQQPRLEVLNEIAEILDVDVRDLIVSNKEEGIWI